MKPKFIEYPYTLHKKVVGENWKQINDFPNYDISDWGRVRRQVEAKLLLIQIHKRTREKDGNILGRPPYVLLKKGDSEIKCNLAELVLIHFDPTFKLGSKIIFKNRNLNDVYISNLKWKNISSMKVGNDVEKPIMDSYCCDKKAESANRRFETEKITGYDVWNVLQIHNFKCFFCGDSIGKLWHLDHFLPVSKLGGNNVRNLVPSCPECNLMKHSMIGQDFLDKVSKIYNHNQSMKSICSD